MDQNEERGEIVNRRLTELLYSCYGDADPVAVRIDEFSLATLQAAGQARGWFSLRQDGKTTWNGLPIILEAPGPQVKPSADPELPDVERLLLKPRILTIEGKSKVSGRTVYINWETNPEGYR